jgi:transposase
MTELFIENILNAGYLHADETPFQVLKEVGRKAEEKSYMWVFKTGDLDRPVILFVYADNRSGKTPEAILQEYKGYIQTDGYAGYNYISRNADQIHLCCWAHVRRKFLAAINAAGKKAVPGIAHKAFDIIKELYKIEIDAKNNNSTSEDIFKVRQEKALPLLKEFKDKLQRWERAVLPKSLTGQAIKYTLKIWDELNVYLSDGRLKIDNNSAENAIRPFAVGRKNWMFSDTSMGARASANFYSIIETARANELDPFWYLYFLFEKLPELHTKEDFIPWLPQNIDREELETFRNNHLNSKQ